MINDKIEETQVVRPPNSNILDIMGMLSKYDKVQPPAAAPNNNQQVKQSDEEDAQIEEVDKD